MKRFKFEFVFDVYDQINSMRYFKIYKKKILLIHSYVTNIF